MKFCCECGAALALRIPDGDNRERHVCDACDIVHYRNPKMVVGAIPEWRDQVLLCRRAIEPRRGFWTLPAGFMECGETSAEGAARETLEEANARIAVGRLFTLFNLPDVDQVFLVFRARLLDLDFSPGSESLDVRLFRESEIPWDELAFKVVHRSLRLLYRDRASGCEGTYSGDIRRSLRQHYEIHMHQAAGDPAAGSSVK